jgi:PncC family amidohydrolase
LISNLITNVSGSSDYYQGSITSYSNETKMKLVGVRPETLKKYGAVSAQVAREMAEGGRQALGTDICIADTGIAGPSGATARKPVGLFYLGLSHKGGTYSRKHIFLGSREQNKKQAALAVLSWLKEYLIGLDSGETSGLRITPVITCFLESRGMILILRRSRRVGTYIGHWAGISGFVETTADKQVLIEIKEETGLTGKDIKLISKGPPLEVVDKKLRTKWIVHPYLFHVKNPDKIELDWEHTESKWIIPDEIDNYSTVPKLKEALAAVMPE